MKNRTVFLTGAEGLLGNHITRGLIARNYKVQHFNHLLLALNVALRKNGRKQR